VGHLGVGISAQPGDEAGEGLQQGIGGHDAEHVKGEVAPRHALRCRTGPNGGEQDRRARADVCPQHEGDGLGDGEGVGGGHTHGHGGRCGAALHEGREEEPEQKGDGFAVLGAAKQLRKPRGLLKRACAALHDDKADEQAAETADGEADPPEDGAFGCGPQQGPDQHEGQRETLNVEGQQFDRKARANIGAKDDADGSGEREQARVHQAHEGHRDGA